jgi:integrase
MGKLTAIEARTAKPGVHGDGDGLYLQVRDETHRSWVYRFMLGGKSRWMGLGAFPDVSLAEAREAAQAARKLTRQGVDPIQTRHVASAQIAAEEPAPTFRNVAAEYIATHEKGWRNDKHRQQWRNTLAEYAYPVIGDLPVSDVTTDAVERVLKPIWHKHETASRLRGRIKAILDYGKVKGWRTGENPAQWEGHLKITLGGRAADNPREHHAALPVKNMGQFMTALQGQDGIGALAFRFLILTATRTSETLNATWREIDLADCIWTVPAARMKANRQHRVPLSAAVMSILAEVGELRRSDAPDAPIFPGRSLDKPLSNMSLLMLLRRMKRPDLTGHGFRSTFRDWAGEETNHAREVVEMALAHTLRDKTEEAYARGDLFEKRRKLMADWAEFCGKSSTTSK